MYIHKEEVNKIWALLQDIYNGEDIEKNINKIDLILLDVCKRYKKQTDKTAKYVAEQRKYNKDFARGKGIKAVKTKEV